MRVVVADFKLPRRPARLLWAVLGVGLALTSAATLHLSWELSALHKEHEARLKAANAPVAARPPVQAVEARYASSALEMQTQRRLAWPLALTALENIAVEGVLVRRLEVSAAEASIRVELVAQSHASALQYLEALNNGSDQENTDLLWTLLLAEAEQTGQSVRATLAARKVSGLASKPPN